MGKTVALLAVLATLGTAVVASTTATADVGDRHWYAHGAAIAASNYARKQLSVDIPWYEWETKCKLRRHGTRAKCRTESKRRSCSGTLRVRMRLHRGGVDAYKRRISCGRRQLRLLGGEPLTSPENSRLKAPYASRSSA